MQLTEDDFPPPRRQAPRKSPSLHVTEAEVVEIARREIQAYADNVLAEGMGMAIGALLAENKERCAELQAEIAELREQFRFTGTWAQDKAYRSGNVVELGGSVWIANAATTLRPGSDSKAWTLIAPRARDGKDGRDAVVVAPHEPPAQRTVRSHR